MSDSLVLYIESSWSSPWVCTVFVTLREKALAFSTAMSMLRKGSGVADAMRDRTLTGAAPVLQHVVRVALKLGADVRGAVFGTFNVLDVELAFALMRLIATGFEVPEAVRAYAATVWARPSVREFIDHARPPNPPVNY